MGVEPEKLPARESWSALLEEDWEKKKEEKGFYYLIWELESQAIGHSNINKLVYGQEAAMHLHVWTPSQRTKGMGTKFVELSLPFYFDTFDLDTLYCEPNALNAAPNKTLQKLGFEFLEYKEWVPGWINFRQPINRYRMTREMYEARQ